MAQLQQNTAQINLQQTQNPNDVIRQFFHHYTFPECSGLLRDILHQALSGYSTRDGIHPADLLRFLEELEKAVEVMYNIALKHPKPRQRGTYPLNTVMERALINSTILTKKSFEKYGLELSQSLDTGDLWIFSNNKKGKDDYVQVGYNISTKLISITVIAAGKIS